MEPALLMQLPSGADITSVRQMDGGALVSTQSSIIVCNSVLSPIRRVDICDGSVYSILDCTVHGGYIFVAMLDTDTDEIIIKKYSATADVADRGTVAKIPISHDKGVYPHNAHDLCRIAAIPNALLVAIATTDHQLAQSPTSNMGKVVRVDLGTIASQSQFAHPMPRYVHAVGVTNSINGLCNLDPLNRSDACVMLIGEQDGQYKIYLLTEGRNYGWNLRKAKIQCAATNGNCTPLTYQMPKRSGQLAGNSVHGGYSSNGYYYYASSDTNVSTINALKEIQSLTWDKVDLRSVRPIAMAAKGLNVVHNRLIVYGKDNVGNGIIYGILVQ